jgi:hypothetical protein
MSDMRESGYLPRCGEHAPVIAMGSVCVLVAIALFCAIESVSGEKALPVAITLRVSETGTPQYPLLPLDLTIEVENLSEQPLQAAALLFHENNPRKLDLDRNRLRIRDPRGMERRVVVSEGALPSVGRTPEPPGPPVAPGSAARIRQIIKVLNYPGRLDRGLAPKEAAERVFLFTTPGTYTLQLELNGSILSNRLAVRVRKPTGREAEAFEYLRGIERPYFVAGIAEPYEKRDRKAAEAFLAEYGDTVYAPYARFLLGQWEAMEAKRELSRDATVTDESFVEVWDDLPGDRTFRLWPWVLKEKADYLAALGRRQNRGFDWDTAQMIARPVVRLGETLTAEQQRAIAEEAAGIRELLDREYPYLPV